jgi:hypothetical protein
VAQSQESTEVRDILDHNCRQHGLLESHALVRSLVTVGEVRLEPNGCGTSLLYRDLSLPKRCSTVHDLFVRVWGDAG